MGKFLSRFAVGAALGLVAMWVLNRLNQGDDSLDDDDDVVEIQIGGNQPANDSVIATSAAAVKPERAKVDSATQPLASSDGADKTTARDKAETIPPAAAGGGEGAANLEWVNGIGPEFNRALSDAGIRTDKDLAKASVEQLRATGIPRSDETFADWIAQAKQRTSGR